MNNYKKLIKSFALAAFVVPVVSSCSDWTDVESLDYNYTLPSEQDPEAYNAYLNLLREYKQNPHKILIAKFDNSGYTVGGQGDRISALPDSTDFVVLQAADSLNPVTEQEMAEIREQKGTRTLYAVSYTDVEAALQAILDREEAENDASQEESESQAEEGGEAEQPAEPEADRFTEVCNQYVDSLLALYDKYGYDGIQVVYSNPASPVGMPEAEKAQLQARQATFFGKIKTWAESHQDAVFIFKGYTSNIMDASIFSYADYIVIPMLDAVSSDDVIWNAEMQLTEGVPADRIVFGVTIPDLADEKATDGYFNGTNEDGTKVYAVVGAAYAVISSQGTFEKAGLCVDNVRDDYFQREYTYGHIRQALQIMN